MTYQDHIAIVEDSVEILSLLKDTFQDAGYRVSTFTHAEEFEHFFTHSTPDLCIIDLGLPDKDGLGLVSLVANTTDASILVLSGRSALEDRVTGLEQGADDYLAKPFEITEVIARARALMRRRAPSTAAPQQTDFQFSGWTANLTTFTLTHDSGETKRLSASEGALLTVFSKYRNKLITREQIQIELDDQSDSISFDRAIDVRVSRLRSKLNDSTKNPKIIKTIYGAGYIFITGTTT